MRKARVISLDSGGGPCVPEERGRERVVRKRRDERQRLAGRREREVLAQSDMNGAEQPLPISHRCDRKYTERNSFCVFSTSDM